MVLDRAIGRPQRALVIDSFAAEAVLHRRNAETIRAELAAVGSMSLPLLHSVILGVNAGEEALANVLPQLLAKLEDGGCVVLDLGSKHARDVAKWVAFGERFALEVMHVEVDPAPLPMTEYRMAKSSAIALRKRPAKRALSLTIGMISMNEAAAVGGVIDDIHAKAPKAEILLVDSSKDETPKIAESKGARVLRQFPPKGYGPAMHRLLYSATTDVIITLDCDGTYPADRISQLHSLIEEGADLVNATRTRHRPTAMPLPNFIANRVFAGAAQVFHGLETTDVHSGMRAYRTSMLRGIDVNPSGAALPVELFVVPARCGYRMVELEIPYFERVGTTTLHRWDSTKWTFKRLANAAVVGSRVSKQHVRVL